MQAGRLDQRITIERWDYLRDSNGEVIQDPLTGETTQLWVEIARVWAAVEPLNGREFIAAQAVQSEITTRIRMRYRADLQPADRIDHEGTLYDIQSIINPRSGDAELVLMCKAVAG